MTVGHALWPDQLDAMERARLDPSVPENLNHSPDVLILGGGMLGVATAVMCVRARLGSVVLLERQTLGAGASGGAAGQLMPEAHVGVDSPELVELGRVSLALWRELHATVPGGVGLLELDWVGLGLTTYPTSGEVLSAEEVDRLVPGLSHRTSGVIARHQARLNPLRALARMAANLSGVATGVEAHSVEIRGGRVASLHTTAGEFQPGVVVFATGTPPQLSGLESRLPWNEVKGHMLVTEPTTLTLPGAVAPLATSIEEGRLMVGGTLDLGDDARVVRPDVIAQMWHDLKSAWPVVRGIEISHQWACFRPAHPDLLPVIDRVDGVDNAWLTTGHYRTGILMAPATGQALASWVASCKRPGNVATFGADRFVATSP